MPELTSGGEAAGKTADYRDEPWAREALLVLPAAERARRAAACRALLEGERPSMSDAPRPPAHSPPCSQQSHGPLSHTDKEERKLTSGIQLI